MRPSAPLTTGVRRLVPQVGRHRESQITPVTAWECMRVEQNQPLYVLGHAENELDRLIRQSRFYGELTEALFRRAGIGPGMRVVDVGCGAGDVSVLLASLVGANG